MTIDQVYLPYIVYVLAPLPSALVFYQFFYLRFRKRLQAGRVPDVTAVKRAEDLQDKQPTPSDRSPVQRAEMNATQLVTGRQRVYFAWSTLFMDLGVPALLLYLGTIAGYKFLTHWAAGVDIPVAGSAPASAPRALLATANLGVFVWFGAYVAALQVLLTRVVRRDITPGMSYRTLVNFFLGVIVGAIVLVIIPSDVKQAVADGAKPVKNDSAGSQPFMSASLLSLALCFSAGFAPQIVVLTLTAIAEKFWSSKANPYPARNDVPISFVNGITPDIESRLADEGITNIANLAFADPQAMIKNTVYSRNQIINWIDQALLMDVLPESWQALRRCGISGALDLASVKDNAVIAKYAKECKLDEDLLKDLRGRLDEDQQVNIVRYLYWDTKPVPETPKNSNPPIPPSNEPKPALPEKPKTSSPPVST